jgi:hypothetical protein
MKTNPHICPNCRERVSAFAAGCALCGTVLDQGRAHGRPTAFQQLQSGWLARRLLPRVRLPPIRSVAR